MAKGVWVSKRVKAQLAATVLRNRRETVYKMTAKRNCGIVRCFVCNKPVDREDASVEHVTPKSKGGTDAIENLAISHIKCNNLRGNSE